MALQLGAQQNLDLQPVRDRILCCLAERDVTVIEVENPLSSPRPDPGDGSRRLRQFPLYPLAAAFDLMISTPGCNSFHECIHGGIAAVFVPKQALEMDAPHLRARFAESAGLGLGLCLADAPLVPRGYPTVPWRRALPAACAPAPRTCRAPRAPPASRA